MYCTDCGAVGQWHITNLPAGALPIADHLPFAQTGKLVISAV